MKDDENQVIDESSWPHCGYGEAGYVINGRLSQNKKFAKGGQTFWCMDAGRYQTRAYMHRHKLYNHKKQGFSAAGTYELSIIQCDFMEMVRGIMSSKRKLFHENPETMVDKYSFMDAILDSAGNAGLGIIVKNARNMLPKDT